MAYNPLAFGLMLISMGAILFSSYVFFWKNNKVSAKQEKTYGTAFILLGIIAGIFGFIIYTTEPIPTQYIEVYGVGYFVYSILLLLGGLCMVHGLDKRPAAYLAGIGGLMLLGSARTIYIYSMSKSPLAATTMFGLSGLGLLGAIKLAHSSHKNASKLLIWLVILAFLIVGLLTFYSGVNAQLGHAANALAKAAS